MSGFVRLAQLKQAIRDRRNKGYGAVTIFNELRSKAQFSDITPEEVKLFYNPLSEEVSAAEFTVEEQVRRNDQKIAVLEPYLRTHEGYLVEHEQLLAEHQQELAVRRQQFLELEEQYEELEENDQIGFEEDQQQLTENQRVLDEHRDQFLKHLHVFEEHQQEFADYQNLVEELRRDLARKQQKKPELEFLSQHQGILQQNPNKFLIYDETLVDPPFIYNFWEGRFFATAGDRDANNGTCSISIYDMFQGKTKSFTFKVAGRFFGIYALRDPYFLLHERRSGNHFLSLAKLDLENESLQVVHSYEPRNFDRILVNESDSSKFLLWRRNDVDECKVVGNSIQLVKNFALASVYFFGSYFEEKFRRLHFVPRNGQFENLKLIEVKMHIYDLERNENSTHDLDNTPDTLDCSNIIFHRESIAWMRDTIFLPVRFKSLEKHGVIYTNPRIRSWKLVEFGVIDSEICFLQSVGSENLLVRTEKRNEGALYERKVYRLQMRKPDFLRNMAWMAIVKLYKEAGAEDPYAEARQHLPFNSELQPFMLPGSSTSTDSSTLSDSSTANDSSTTNDSSMLSEN